MFYGATKPDPIELAEDAESISLMLAFIYPVAPPHINTIDHLEKIMKVSQKYDVERMTKFIEEAVTLGSKLMTLDPITYCRVISAEEREPTHGRRASAACKILPASGSRHRAGWGAGSTS
ncbi:hypothetical protein AG1IA_10333 [Rhizoctonia solani AG-1 IA]|uniref:BTB domain-containing protein n=1 Tax=Thanatephorus cucumeris (strain AG1-IA) TaxID=983506 RepID=L8WFY6_THACA|nr:hypothetical protein AG1IA_10333 [Rhizoctonia solani AG-1 IA]